MVRLYRTTLPCVVSFVLGTGVPTTAFAEIYKWVDEKGVVNYSSEPPKGGRKTEKLDARAPGLSIVPSNGATNNATGTKDADQELRQRVARLERDLEDERRTRAAAATQDEAEQLRLRQAREQCERERRVDCDIDPFGTRYGTGWAAAPVVVAPAISARVRPIFRQPRVLSPHFPPEQRNLSPKYEAPLKGAQSRSRH
jgi:hypothetical protein